MSEQTMPSDTVRPEESSASGACCAAIGELRTRAEQAAALRAQQPGADDRASTPAPTGDA
ncbi:hypothetical protein [Streptomyces sp. NBC_00696]|uniref:hypothetical protein n=1 Tax=Streptomyces sp. NBC_00696 TaxID=2903672 RepID=UPI002E323A71|nr:hypothetical protein [Streptomyces sp. NBC_00696]